MKIGEAAKLIGMTASNIRFYEKKGLLEPEREEASDYRNYSSADVERLKMILVYRKMGISVETISRILKKEITLEDAAEETLEGLCEKKELLEGSIALCKKVLEDRPSDPLNIDHYLKYVSGEEAKGVRYPQVEDFFETLAEASGSCKFRADPYIGMIFKNLWAARILGAGMFFVILAAPTIHFIEMAAKGQRLTAGALFLWIGILLVYFLGLLKAWKKKRTGGNV